MYPRHESLIRKYFEQVWNKGNMSVVDSFISPYFNSNGSSICGPELVKLYISEYRAAFPRTRFTILSMCESGDKVTVCWACTGTHRATNGPDGKEIAATGMSVYRIADDKIDAVWVEPDEVGAHAQIGIRYGGN